MELTRRREFIQASSDRFSSPCPVPWLFFFFCSFLYCCVQHAIRGNYQANRFHERCFEFAAQKCLILHDGLIETLCCLRSLTYKNKVCDHNSCCGGVNDLDARRSRRSRLPHNQHRRGSRVGLVGLRSCDREVSRQEKRRGDLVRGFTALT